MKKQLLSLVMMLLPMVSMADAVEIDGIYYNLNSEDKVAEVTSNPNKYIGYVNIPESVTYEGVKYNVTAIGNSAFYNCKKLDSITIPNGVTEISGWSFDGCTSLTSIDIPNSVIFIGKNAFSACKSLSTLSIGSSVAQIEEAAFQYCSNLLSVTIPHSVREIGVWAFNGCSNMNTLTILDGVTTIGQEAIMNCISLKEITIPQSVKSIGRNIISHCSSVEKIIIDSNNLYYDSRDNCNSIIRTEDNVLVSACNNAIIPNGVKTIDAYAFSACSNMINLEIPNSVTTIKTYAFSSCKKLDTVIAGNNLMNIEYRAFYECSTLKDFICYTEQIPDASEEAFNIYYYTKHATLHVPSVAIQSYKTAEPWKSFGKIVAITPPQYKLLYIIDGSEYKSYMIEEGEAIIPEPVPTKEGYTFSGWSEIPETMPAHDVTVTGTFTKDNLPKCATPVIDVVVGKIKLSCETEDVIFKTNVTYNCSSKSLEGEEEINLSRNITCHISVIATKEGYEDSDTVTKDVKLRAGAAGDVNSDGDVNVGDIVTVTNIMAGYDN